MKANYGPRFLPGLDESRAIPLNSKTERLVSIVWQEAQRQFDDERDRLTMSIISCMLVALNRRYGFGEKRLTDTYKDAVRLIGSWKADLRGDCERKRTGENPENYALLDELRKIGVDLDELERLCEYNADTGEVSWKERNA